MKLEDLKVGQTYIFYDHYSMIFYKILAIDDKIHVEKFIIRNMGDGPPIWRQKKEEYGLFARDYNMDTMTQTKKHYAFQLIFRK